MVSSLSPGQTGCLRSGTYNEFVRLNKNGQPGAPIVVRSAPGELATLTNNVYAPPENHDVTLSHVKLTATTAGQVMLMQIYASRATIANNDISASDRRNSCILVAGGAVDVEIRANRIHNCGSVSSGNQIHGIYLSNGRRTKVLSNYIYAVLGGWGVHLWTNADDSLIANNVIDGNRGGIVLGGNSSSISERNAFRDNIITNSVDLDGMRTYWGGQVGAGNVFDRNCVWNNKVYNTVGTGYTISNLVTADPKYVNRSARDYRLQSGSPCAGKGPTVTVGPTG
jgi:parallel beta-helix repeat protein